jgi:hypothetical protein
MLTDDEAEFLKAKLDEDEAEAQGRCGIFPSPAVEDSGAVWLHVKRGGNAVVVRYMHPADGYGDMADLRSWADADHGWTQDRALREVKVWRKLLLEYHSAPLDAIYGGTERETGFRLALSAALKAKIATYEDNPVTELARP